MNSWRRTMAVVGLVALAVLHISAAIHQLEHVADQDFGVCQTCSAYNSLEDLAIASPPPIEIPQFVGALHVAEPALPWHAPAKTAYLSRAPPLS